MAEQHMGIGANPLTPLLEVKDDMKVTLPEAMAIVFECLKELDTRTKTLEQLAEVNDYEPD